MGELLPRPPWDIVGLLVNTADCRSISQVSGLGAYPSILAISADDGSDPPASIYHYPNGREYPHAIYSSRGIINSYHVDCVSVPYDYRSGW